MNVLMKIVACFVQSLLWLGIVFSPTLVGCLFGLAICALNGELNIYLIATFGCFGLIAGLFWAERIRRSVGLSNFWGRLISQKEFQSK